jgi:hypothetical protein
MAGNHAVLNNFLTWADVEDEVRAALYRKGIDDKEDLLCLDVKDMVQMCAIIRRTTRPPDALGNAVPNAVIPYKQEVLLAKGAYYLRHLEHTQRPYTLTNQAQTQAAMAPMKALIKRETVRMKNNDPDKIPVLTAASGTGIRVLIENLEEHWHRILGASGVPLTYIVRRLGEPPAEEDKDWHRDLDPICGEMVARAPHEGTDFIEDNRHVWHIIRDATYSLPAWSWISGYERQMNGRAAFNEIHKHFLGEHHQSVIKMAAEKALQDSYFAGDRRNFTFEMFAALNKQAQHGTVWGDGVGGCESPQVSAWHPHSLPEDGQGSSV